MRGFAPWRAEHPRHALCDACSASALPGSVSSDPVRGPRVTAPERAHALAEPIAPAQRLFVVLLHATLQLQN